MVQQAGRINLSTGQFTYYWPLMKLQQIYLLPMACIFKVLKLSGRFLLLDYAPLFHFPLLGQNLHFQESTGWSDCLHCPVSHYCPWTEACQSTTTKSQMCQNFNYVTTDRTVPAILVTIEYQFFKPQGMIKVLPGHPD